MCACLRNYIVPYLLPSVPMFPLSRRGDCGLPLSNTEGPAGSKKKNSCEVCGFGGAGAIGRRRTAVSEAEAAAAAAVAPLVWFSEEEESDIYRKGGTHKKRGGEAKTR